MAAILVVIIPVVDELVTKGWDFTLGALVNLFSLGKKARRLEEEMSRLQALRDDVKNTAEEEAHHPMMEVTPHVLGWITRVDNLRQKVATFQESYETQSICITAFFLGYDAVQLQTQVEELIEQGNVFWPSGLTRRRSPKDFQDVPLEIPSSILVGAEKTMLQIQGHIMDDAVRVIGICGMGGVGKTTLLKVINNKFLREEQARDMFNLSIWVALSPTVDILGIQKSIGERLGLTLSSSRQGEPSTDGILRQQQADILSVELSKKRFIVFLDDMWEKIDLKEIGIPDKSSKHKILFTTRSERVCRQMNADQVVKVGLLDPEDSWTLFKSNMGKTSATVDNNPDVREIAKQVVAKCGGLPITLVTVGRAMAYATTIHEWRDALHALDQRVEEVIGMEPVLASLKFCFDRLNNTSLQSCLLYCAFYPEDWDIPKEEIIDYWISEGFLDPEGYIDTHIGYTRDRGHAWIRRLQSACLLEDGNFDVTIRLNDSIRDMLMWIGKEEYVMLAGKNIAQIPRREIWERAKGISLMHNQAPSFFWELRCEALTTLILQMTDFGRTIQKGFFGCTRSLRVLDLSYTQIEALPSDITTLVELRYLSLEHTEIASLPEELAALTNLRFLNLNYTANLMEIPREAVSRLISLQVLKMKGSEYSFSAHSELGLSDLENLGLLCELSATVKACSSFLHDIAGSNTFSRCIRELQVELCPEHDETGDLKLTFGPGHFPNLKFLQLSDLKEAEIVIKPAFREYQTGSKQPIFERLQELMIYGCHGLRDLTWVGQLPLLERIEIWYCEKITELLLLDGGDLPNDGRTIFTRLKYMSLYELPSLRSVSKHVLHFPSLEGLVVKGCPNLKTLPFGPGSAEGIRWIRGEQEWWNELEWDEPGVKSYFFMRFEAWE